MAFIAGMKSNRCLCWTLCCVGTLAASLPAAPALGQVTPDPNGRQGQLLQREARLREFDQFDLDTRQRANEGVAPEQRALFDYGAYLQFNYLSLDDQVGNNHVLRQYDFIPYFRLNIDGAQELFVRARLGYRDFNEGDSFNGHGDEPVDGDIERAYYRFDLRRYNAAYGKNLLNAAHRDFNLTFQGGRDLVYWANGLVLGQTLDGVTVGIEKGIFDLQVIGGVTPVRTVDFDTSRPGFYYNTRRGFFGGMLSAQVGEHRPFVYGLVQRDYNKDDFLSLGIVDTKYDYNSWYLGVGSSGALSDHLRYGLEMAYEGGSTLSNSFILTSAGGLFPIDQTRDSIQAFGLDGRLDYLVNDPRQTRFSAEVIATTGDRDRGSSSNTFNGNKAGTNDHAFNAFGLLNTGLAFAPDASNLLVVRLGAAAFPFPDYAPLRRLQLGTDFFIISKFQTDAPIDEQTTAHRFLGYEPDLYLNWQVTSDLTLALRYGLFFPSERALGASSETRQFIYGGITFSF